jgi:hypothetical protein
MSYQERMNIVNIVSGLLIIFIIGGLTSEIIDNGSQIYYYRKGL